MKQFIFIFFLAFTINSFAQTNRGGRIITSRSDVSFIFGSNTITNDGAKQKEIKSKKISFVPSYGKFVADNLAFGILLNIQHQKNVIEDLTNTTNWFDENEGEEQQTTYGIAPYFRYYLVTNEKIKPFFDFDFGYHFLDIKLNDNLDTYQGTFLDGSMGFATFFNENISFDVQVSLGYSKMFFSADRSIKLETRGTGILLGISIVI